MRVPLRWLSEYVDLSIDVKELARRLTVAGLEVADIITAGEWSGISVAYVEKIEPHPNADRLWLATVRAGGAGPYVARPADRLQGECEPGERDDRGGDRGP